MLAMELSYAIIFLLFLGLISEVSLIFELFNLCSYTAGLNGQIMKEKSDVRRDSVYLSDRKIANGIWGIIVLNSFRLALGHAMLLICLYCQQLHNVSSDNCNGQLSVYCYWRTNGQLEHVNYQFSRNKVTNSQTIQQM